MRASVRSTLASIHSLGAVLWSDTNAFVKIRLFVVLILVVAAAVLTALGPVALKLLVDSFTQPAAVVGIGIYLLVALYVLSQWLSRSAGELRGFIYARVERRVIRALSERVFDHLMRLPMRFHFSRRTGALLKAPLLYVFDEPTSALDSKNERAILQSIAEVSASKTALMIAHRLSTVVHADEIIVFDQGRVVERGRHEQLLKADGYYAALWRAPASPNGRRANDLSLSDDMIHARQISG